MATETDFHQKLLEHSEWVKRRVETVHLVGESYNERTVSLDIDVARIRSWRKELDLAVESEVLVPIANLTKDLIFDFDLRDGSGRALSLAPRSEDSRISANVLASNVPGETPGVILDYLYEVAFGFTETSLQHHDGGLGEYLETSRATEVDKSAAMRWWENANENRRLIAGLRYYSEHFTAFARIGLDQDSLVVKYRRLESSQDAARWLEMPSRRPSGTLSVLMLNAGRAQSEHFRVVAPPGIFFMDAFLLPLTEDRVTFDLRTTEDRLLFYTRGVKRGTYAVLATTWPVRRGFMRPALYLSGYSTLVLLLGALSEFLVDRGTIDGRGILGNGNTDAAITLLLAVPSIIIVFLLRSDEHEIRRHLLNRWRMIALATLVPMWAAAVAILFDQASMARFTVLGVWTSCGLLALVFHVMLQRQNHRLRRAWKKARSQSGHTRRVLTVLAPPERAASSRVAYRAHAQGSPVALVRGARARVRGWFRRGDPA